jgi:rubrerythrin
MVLEQRSISFYLDRAEQVEHTEQKALFLQLADEEKKHYRLLQDLADFVRRPKAWLENAEFCLFEDY